MPTPQKEAAVEELTDKMRRAKLAVVTDYRGLTVTTDIYRGLWASLSAYTFVEKFHCNVAGSHDRYEELDA